MKLLLASASSARRAMLAAAAVPFDVQRPDVDEESMKAGLRAEGCDPRSLADALAELKAIKLSLRHPQSLVLGCDQVLALDDGSTLDKPVSRDDARDQLRGLRGRSHRLLSAAVIAEQGSPVWRHIETAKLQMRDFSDAFLEAYLDAEYDQIAGCVGSYRIEGPGAQLFTRIDGSYFCILGLPLLPLLDYLRVREVISS